MIEALNFMLHESFNTKLFQHLFQHSLFSTLQFRNMRANNFQTDGRILSKIPFFGFHIQTILIPIKTLYITHMIISMRLNCTRTLILIIWPQDWYIFSNFWCDWIIRRGVSIYIMINVFTVIFQVILNLSYFRNFLTTSFQVSSISSSSILIESCTVFENYSWTLARLTSSITPT